MLIDELLWAQHAAALPHPWQQAPLERALVVRMDNVYALAQALGKDAAERDFDELVPNVAPLAPATWCEVGHPAFTWAAFLTAVDVPDGDERERAWHDLYGRCGLCTREERPEAQTAWAAARWVVLGFVLYEQPGDRELRLPRLPIHLWVDHAGHVVSRQWLWSEAVAPDRDVADEEMEMQETLLNTALIGVCFAHCKGVVIAEHQQSRQQRRAAERAGRPPLVTYRTIDIAPVARMLRDDGQAEKTGIHHALHICRGHFAQYSDERPLFGKYSGTFYRPLHVRGTPQRGAIIKDYRVLTPEHEG